MSGDYGASPQQAGHHQLVGSFGGMEKRGPAALVPIVDVGTLLEQVG